MRTRLLAVATAAFLLLPLTATAGASDGPCDDRAGVEHSCDEDSRR